MQYVLLTVRNDEGKVTGYDAITTDNQTYRDSRIRYNNAKIEVCVFNSSSKDEFFQILYYLVHKINIRILDILNKEGLLK